MSRELTPAEKRDQYQKVYALIYELERCLNLGKTGDATARATEALFDAIPQPLRGRLEREGAERAMARLQRGDGPVADAIDRIFRNCKADAGYMGRLCEFWECVGSSRAHGVDDEEDADYIEGENDDENAVPVRRGGVRGPSPKKDGAPTAEAPGEEQAGGPKEEFIYPDDGSSPREIEESPVEGDAAAEFGDDGDGGEGDGGAL